MVRADDQRVIACSGKRSSEASVDPLPVMADLRGFSVHQDRRAADGAAVGGSDRLMPQANSEDRRGRAQEPDEFDADARMFRPPGPRRDQNSAGFQRDDLLQSERVVPDHPVVAGVKADELDEVVRERIVVVDDQNQREIPSAIRSASTSARALLVVSSYSRAGSESATLPAPACQEIRPVDENLRRNRMHMSIFPEKSKKPTPPRI